MKLQMSKRHWTPIALGLVFGAPALLPAQIPLADPSSQTVQSQTVGGKLSVDLVTISQDALGVPLRHGAVIAGSEEVILDGKKLQPGQDYKMDNDAGMVYLLVPTKAGEAVSVSYRYDASRAHAGESAPSAAFAPVRLNFGNAGSMGVMLGMGMAERTADGSVLTSNLFGVSNNLNLGGASLNGLMMVGHRTQQQASSAFEYQANTLAPGQGNSRLILQSLGGNLGGGTYKLDFQDISQNFTGFSALTGNGYDAATASQLAKEKGLRRMGFTLDKVQFGGLGFNESFKSVGDKAGGITWQNYGLNVGGLTLNYASQDVGQHFDRFPDLAETDRQQLQKEAGILRKAMSAEWKASFGLLSFSDSAIDDTNGNGINRQDLKFSGARTNFEFGSQDIDKSFTRFGDLGDPNAGQWAKEGGLKRRWMSLDSMVFGANAQPLKFATYRIDSPTGDMSSVDASAGTKTWSFDHIERKVESGFSSLPNLTQQEIDANIGAISNMYVQGGMPVKPEDRTWYLQSPGISRDFTRFTLTPSAKWKMSYESLALQGKQDNAGLSNFSVVGGSITLSYRQMKLGQNFTELPSLMTFEKQRLGAMAGLDRSDLNFAADLAKNGKLALSQSKADTSSGGFNRQTVSYVAQKLQFSMNTRRVDKGFATVGQLLDPEAPLLAQMIGGHEADYQFKWQAMPNLRLEASSWNGFDPALGKQRSLDNYLVDWKLANGAELNLQKSSADPNNPMAFVFANILQRMSYVQDFGKMGKLSLNQQSIDYNAVPGSQPDSKQTDLAYETKLTDNTSLKTEQVQTQYQNGDTQHVSSNTINTTLTKQAGLSLSDVAINGTGAVHDQHNRNVGFWLNLWNNVRLNLGAVDSLNTDGTSTTQHTLSLSPGSIGNMQIGSANYMANTWQQGDRTQAASNISLSTIKPFSLGFVKDIKLNMGQDTAADNGAWLKENKTFGASGSIGKNAFSYNFFSQMNNLQQRGIDRSFSLMTDQSDKSRLQAKLFYKQRSLPGDQNVAIRNFSITARPINGFTLTNEMLTNPEIPRGDVLLGTMPQPIRVNKWKLDYVRDPNCQITGSWEEQRNDDTNALTRLGGVTFTLFQKTGSPVSLFLGVQQAGGNVPNQITNRWSLEWDQKPGPNQALSLFIGNVTYGGTISPGQKHHNLSIDFQYQYRFK